MLLNSFGSVPEGVAVCVLQGSVCREQDFIVDDTTLFRVVFYFLVIFTEQLFAALVSSANTIMQGTYEPAYNFVGPGIVDENGMFYDCLLYTSRCV